MKLLRVTSVKKIFDHIFEINDRDGNCDVAVNCIDNSLTKELDRESPMVTRTLNRKN